MRLEREKQDEVQNFDVEFKSLRTQLRLSNERVERLLAQAKTSAKGEDSSEQGSPAAIERKIKDLNKSHEQREKELQIEIDDQRAVGFSEFSSQNHDKTGTTTSQERKGMPDGKGVRPRVYEDADADRADNGEGDL